MSDETVRLTYAELAKARGITQAAAKRMAMRHRWPKQIGNDGLSRVSVPASALVRDTGADGGATTGIAIAVVPNADTGVSQQFSLDEARLRTIIDAAVAAGDDARVATMSAALADIRQVVPVLQDAISSLRIELFRERERADRAEQRVRELEAQLGRRWWRRR